MHAALCGNGRLDYGDAMTSSGQVKHVEADIDCGGTALAASLGTAASGCPDTCKLGMKCFVDADCSGSQNGAARCVQLPASGPAVLAGHKYASPPALSGTWPDSPAGTCVRSDALRPGGRALSLRLWLWGVKKNEFAFKFLARVLAQALGDALASTWRNLHGRDADLGNGVAWGDLVVIMQVSDASASARALQEGAAGGSSAATEVQVAIMAPDSMTDGELHAASVIALRHEGVPDRVLAAAPGLPLMALTSDAQSASVATVSPQEDEPAAGGDSGGALGGLQQGTQIALVGGFVAIVAIAAAAFVVSRRRAAAGSQSTTIVGSAGSRAPDGVGETIFNPLALAVRPPAPGTVPSARSQRIQQLRKEFEPETIAR